MLANIGNTCKPIKLGGVWFFLILLTYLLKVTKMKGFLLMLYSL